MGRRRLSRYGLANLSLGLSILFAVAAFVYLALAGSPLRGAALGGLVLAAGYWEYRRKIGAVREFEFDDERLARLADAVEPVGHGLAVVGEPRLGRALLDGPLVVEEEPGEAGNRPNVLNPHRWLLPRACRHRSVSR